MFIFNLTKDELVYRAHGEVIKLKRGLNLINNCITSAKELKAHFGDFIKFIEDEVIPAKKEEVKVEETKDEEITIEDENPAELEEACEECVLQPAEEVKEEKAVEEVKETKPTKKATKKSNKKNK